MSQRELAAQAGVDFTYLSKLENDRIAPPSAKTISTLAAILDADADELAVLAGKIPADLVEVLTLNPGAIKLFRSLAGDLRSQADWDDYFRRQAMDRQQE
jgi:transcriptional regulator with XRE-family HTH domain